MKELTTKEFEMVPNYSIGVVTYVNRYHTYFKKNILSLKKHFPDKTLICIINGHPDKIRHLTYLKEITTWLSAQGNIKYMTFENHQPLAKCWNLISILSHTQHNLFLNDDVLIQKGFRTDFERSLSKNDVFFTINKSFSHFMLSKNIIKSTGWFDERFLGVGQEDGDFLIRLFNDRGEVSNFECRNIVNYVAPNTDPGFKSISSTTDDKYSLINKEFMNKKWIFNHYTNETFIPEIKFTWNDELYLVRLREGQETPIFYEYSILDNENAFAEEKKDTLVYLKDLKKDFKKYVLYFLKSFKS